MAPLNLPPSNSNVKEVVPHSHRTKIELPPLRSTFLFAAKDLNPSAKLIDFTTNEKLHSTRQLSFQSHDSSVFTKLKLQKH